MDKKFLEDVEKAMLIDQQIRKEREAETEMVDKMTDKERVEYLKQKELRAAEFAKKLGMNQKEITLNDKKGV